MLIKEKIKNTFFEISSGLRLLDNDFYIIGASAMILSGIDIQHTEDVDILTSTSKAHIIYNHWKDNVVDNYIPPRSDLFKSVFNRYRFSFMDIEVQGDLKVFVENAWIPLVINDYFLYQLGDLEIKIPTLQEQRKILTLFGRDKDMQRVKLIDKYLNTEIL